MSGYPKCQDTVTDGIRLLGCFALVSTASAKIDGYFCRRHSHSRLFGLFAVKFVCGSYIRKVRLRVFALNHDAVVVRHEISIAIGELPKMSVVVRIY